jgi:toxin-antitoxin system PIN domain toxin
MILLDNDILIYALTTALPQHNQARAWLSAALKNSYHPIAISITSILGFIRITTNPKIFKLPLSIIEVQKRLLPLLAHSNVRVVNPTKDHFEKVLITMRDNNLKDDDTMDAHLAVLALSLGAKLATNDKSFARFSGLRLINPLRI